MKPPAVAAVCFGLALLSFFRYPGHTWLQQDTQIYVPIMEHQRDPTVLRNDLLVQQPQVAFTLYDEITRSLRALTGQDFREVLAAQQIVTRALGIWGFYLMATALGFSAAPALLIASVCALGARITGPEVLSFEYEPTPRAFAVPLLFCAIGLTAHRRYLPAALAAACAFLYHPPTALPFWALFFVLAIATRNWKSLAPLLLSAALLALMARSDGSPPPFGQLTPLQEQLQRMRAAYSWVSTWHAAWILHYCLLCVIAAIAFVRLRSRIPRELKLFLLGLPLLGMLSMPASWLLLEHWKWLLVPQFQPMRALLFVAVAMQFLTAAAGACAAIEPPLAGGRRVVRAGVPASATAGASRGSKLADLSGSASCRRGPGGCEVPVAQSGRVHGFAGGLSAIAHAGTGPTLGMGTHLNSARCRFSLPR